MSLAFPIATTGLSLLGNIYGQVQANKAQKKAENFLAQRRNDLGAMFNKDYYQNILDTDSVRAGLSQLQKNMKEAGKVISNTAVQGGATPEAVIAKQGNMQDKYQNAVTNMLSIGQQHKDNALSRYQYMTQGLDNQQQGLLQSKADSWNNFSNNIGGASGGLLNAWAMGAFDKKK